MAENASLVRSFVGRQQPCELENGETAHWLSSCLFCSCVQLCVCSCVCVAISVKAYWLLSSRVWACRLCNLSAKNSVAVMYCACCMKRVWERDGNITFVSNINQKGTQL